MDLYGSHSKVLNHTFQALLYTLPTFDILEGKIPNCAPHLSSPEQINDLLTESTERAQYPYRNHNIHFFELAQIPKSEVILLLPGMLLLISHKWSSHRQKVLLQL